MDARVAGGGPAALTALLERLARRVGSSVGSDGLLVCGLHDPMLPGPRGGGPLAVLAAIGPNGPPPWSAAVLEAADVRIPLTEADVRALDVPLDLPPIGLPAPPVPADGSEGRGGLDMGDATPAAIEIWRAEMGEVPRDGPAVTWIRGTGSAPLASAAEAWATGRAVVALPGTIDDPLLSAGGTLRPRTTLEAVEITSLLLGSAPLAWRLSARGRRAIASLASADEVADRLAAALVAAGLVGPDAGARLGTA